MPGLEPRQRAIAGAIPLAACLTVISSLGCGDNDGRTSVIADDSRRNVMIIDDGIDPALPAFQASLAAAFTVVCDAAPADGAASPADVSRPEPGEGGADDFDALKKELLAELAMPDESCHLRPGIAAKAPFGETVADRRQRWNRTLRDDDNLFASDLEPIPELMEQYLANADFHGTSTAATAAFDLAELRLILVEQPLRTMEEATAEVECLRQETVDSVVALLSDAEVRQAYLARPQPAIDRELAALRAAEHVALVNESFGTMPRIALEKALLFRGCPPVELHAYVRVLAELLWAFDRVHAEPDVLFVRAAGNDAAALNDGDDGLECRPGDLQQLLVGAYGLGGARSRFTNFGDCVDVYAPGEFVVAPIPGDWLALLSGTSFATPLTLRRILFAAPQPFSPATARAALLAERQPGSNLDLSLFRPEQVLDLRALAGKRSGALTTAAAMAPAGATRAARWPTSTIRRTLDPLRWATRARLRPRVKP